MNINKIVLAGRLTADQELKKTKTDKSVVYFTVAVNRGKENADFIDCVAFDKTAENICKYFVTGIPAAFTVRYGHEYLLYMYKGKLRPVALEERGKIHTVFTERVQRHSQKPEISFDIIERLYPAEKKIELYARRTRPGWDCWGNEV